MWELTTSAAVLDGLGRPRDDGPEPVPEAYRHVNGLPLNPITRAHPDQFLETGVSAIDGLITFVRGQKLPIFSGAGLPANALAARIAAQTRAPDDDTEVVVVFAAMGVTRREAAFFRGEFMSTGAASSSILLLNLADDPTIETAADAPGRADHGRVPGLRAGPARPRRDDRHDRLLRGAPGDLGRARGDARPTRLPRLHVHRPGLALRTGRPSPRRQRIADPADDLTMPDDDITHPIPDLTGYITEGQIVLSRDLDRQGVAPPIDVLPSLSRLMNAGIGAGKTREDHRGLADQLYACYARGREVRRLMSIVGESGLPPEDQRYLAFAAGFESTYLDQGDTRRTLAETLDLGWRLLDPFPGTELKRLTADQLAEHHRSESRS